MSEATPEAPAQEQPNTEEPELEAEPKAEETDWKAEARKWEQRSKENKSEADRIAAVQRDQLDAIAKALGLKGDETPDPEKLTEQLTAEQAKAREAAVQLAVYRNATEHGANPDALLDSASFLRSLADIDPTDAKAVGEAIEAAVEANPRLAATDGSKTRSPRPDPTQGRQSGKPLDPRAADLAQIEADLAAHRR